ncbi:hypothetical protein AcV7_007203 [Taiwanofungus camphoratus]|nr:hypothetical protein AcV7_007203 [Antrodia cinnamomea]
MLKNPDIAPSTSINHWTVAILTFHFTIVHVSGTMHGPNGLSQRTPQPSNTVIEETDKDFDDWIDHMHSFVHQILPPPPTPIMSVLTNAEAEDSSNFKKEEDSYEIVLRSEQAQLTDARLNEVLKFH